VCGAMALNNMGMWNMPFQKGNQLAKGHNGGIEGKRRQSLPISFIGGGGTRSASHGPVIRSSNLLTGLAFEAIDDLCNRLQIAGAFLDDVAVCIDNVVLSCCFLIRFLIRRCSLVRFEPSLHLISSLS